MRTFQKINMMTRSNSRVIDGHFIVLKGSVHQKGSTILNLYALNDIASKYRK